jgi:hypothetical protein
VGKDRFGAFTGTLYVTGQVDAEITSVARATASKLGIPPVRVEQTEFSERDQNRLLAEACQDFAHQIQGRDIVSCGITIETLLPHIGLKDATERDLSAARAQFPHVQFESSPGFSGKPGPLP